jgi:hypothetical protein
LWPAPAKWTNWEPSFRNYLGTIPGCDGPPLSYVIRTNDQPDPTPHANFLDDYVVMAPVHGDAFSKDAATVHTLIVKLIAGNELAYTAVIDGNLHFQALRDHFKGVGVLANDVTQAEKTLSDLFYMGENPPHMWWSEFQKCLDMAFLTASALPRDEAPNPPQEGECQFPWTNQGHHQSRPHGNASDNDV